MQKTIRGTTYDTATAQLICAGRWPIVIWDDNRRVEQTRLAMRHLYRQGERYFLYDDFLDAGWKKANDIQPLPPSRAKLIPPRLRQYAQTFKTEFHEIATI